MKFELLFPFQIERDWERIGALLAPAIAHDDQRQAADVYRDLISGDMALIDVDLPNAKGVAVIELRDRCCWLIYGAGRIAGRRREWIERTRTLMGYFVGIARARGCTEIRIEGRNWRRIFPDWEYVGGERAELRKGI